MEGIYTSTGLKYIRHMSMINGLRLGPARPQSLQISLTNKCNLKCTFCSVAGRQRDLEWPVESLKDAIFAFIKCGIGTVELTGAGEPTLYPYLSDIVTYCKQFDLKLGLITNGIRLKNIPRGTLEKFTWIRVSLTTLDYIKELELPQLENPVLGFSYIVGQKEMLFGVAMNTLTKISDYVKQYNPAYVRIVPECFADKERMPKIHEMWGDIVKHDFGPPFFFQYKTQDQAKYCRLDAVKPWLHTDGYVYPCNSISLNTDANRDFTPEYRICHWTEIEKYYGTRGSGSIPWVKEKCDRCTFCQNNEILNNLLRPIIHEEFV